MKRTAIVFVAVTMAFIAWIMIVGVNSYDAKWQQIENITDCVVWNETPQLSDTMTWTGVCKDGHTSGSGKLVWRFMKKDAWVERNYTGEMANGKKNGHGVEMHPDTGGRYVGSWKNGKKNGHGVYMNLDHTRYEGGFLDGQFEGHGKLWFENSKYTGKFKNGEFHGRGILRYTPSKFCDAEWNSNEFVTAYKSGEGVCERAAEIGE